jgi:putative ABC transport system substrate-binding protein
LLRPEFVKLGGAAVAWPISVRAQQSKLPRLGFIGSSTASAMSSWIPAFIQRLGELGWVQDRTIPIEYEFVEGHSDRYAAIASDFRSTKG